MINKQTPQDQLTAYVVAHTHWDREWRYPIWQTRLMLLDFMDELIDLLETGKYYSFLMDGQVSPVLDYLEHRPEKKEKIQKLISEGKLEIGPWLTLPDEFPVDGESLVRNLLLGHRQASKLGKVFNVGYTPFGWGQTAQLPQIYAGFGIDVTMVGKRVNKKRAPQSEFMWRSPDGTELLSTRFGEWGRQNFYFKIHLSALFGTFHEGPGWEYNWEKGGLAFHISNPDQFEQDHFRLDAPEQWYPEYINQEVIDETWHTTDDSIIPDHRLMMNGCDYTSGQKLFPEMLERIKKIDNKNRKWVQASMAEFADVMRNKIDKSKLQIVHGELRDGPAGAVTGNALTTRLYLKQLNKVAQNMLIRYAEPMTTLNSLLGFEVEISLLEKAWDYLLKSHPHDSINGVTQDKTANDTENRLNQVIDISRSLGIRAMQDIIRQINTSKFNDKDVLLVVFNPMPYPRREILEAWINYPYEETHDYFIADPDGLLISDADGNLQPTQFNGSSVENYCVAEGHTRAFPYKCKRFRMFFDTGMLPACGYKVFKAEKFIQENASDDVAWSNSQAMTDNLIKSPTRMENEFLSISFNSDGTFNLTDKTLDKTFNNLNYFTDRGEAGNYWINNRPAFNQEFSSIGGNARIWVDKEGPVCSTIAAEIIMPLPQTSDEQKRSDSVEDMKITSFVTLKKDQKSVEVKVELENKIENHYLKVNFPTDLKNVTHADSGGHFIVNHRPIKPQGPTEDSYWPDMATQPHDRFVDISNGKYGFAIINDSFTEYEVLKDNHTLALSMLRAVKNWICTEIRAGSDFPSQKGGQSLRKHVYNYSIIPHEGNWEKANIDLAAAKLNTPCQIVQTRKNPAGKLDGNKLSMFSIDNSAVSFSALKKSQDRDSYILRICNPSAKKQKTNITFLSQIKNSWATNLNEERMEKLEVKNENSISISLDQFKIQTIELEI